jgi:hypothetical protein
MSLSKPPPGGKRNPDNYYYILLSIAKIRKAYGDPQTIYIMIEQSENTGFQLVDS